MIDYYVNAILDTSTGEVTRYIIAEDGLTLGLGLTETVYRRKPLTDFFGTDFPVEVVTRRPLATTSIRVQIEAIRAELGKAAPDLLSGKELAAALFGKKE